MPEWIISQKKAPDRPQIPGIDPAIAGILERRGVAPEMMADFLSPRPRATYDPFLLPDMEEAAELILQCAKEGLKVCVYGDYDADGVTSAALLVQVLGTIFERPTYYIPSRFADGYGLNMTAVKKVAEMGTDLLITVDCGSTSPAEVSYAMELGMKVIVTDHHTPGEGPGDGVIFVNPKRSDCAYPFRELSGCGVAFKLAQALQRKMTANGDDRFSRALLNSQLDLVAISTVADVVPLLDENRSFVKYGLECINSRKRPGLKILLDVLDYSEKDVDSDRIAYMLAPNINALGRMGSAAIGVELFSGRKCDGSASEDLHSLALTMKSFNLERKAEQEKTFAICRAALEKGDCGDYFPVILADGAHEGVAGIVAGNIKEEMYRPVCIVTSSEDGLLKGTGRSVPGINIYELLSKNSHLFVRYGGHSGACGLTMDPAGLSELRENLQKQVKELADGNPGVLTEKIVIEKELSKQEKSLMFAKRLAMLEPYGEANLRPLFCLMNAKISGLRRMGADGRHLRFIAAAPDGIPVDCVLFKRASEFEDVLASGRADVAGELSINEFNGTEKLQIIVHDIKGV